MGSASSATRRSKKEAGSEPPGAVPRPSLHPDQSSKPQDCCPNELEDIAIVGIGCRTPGADNIQEFWRVLQNGECHITDVPADRWNAKAFLDPDPMAPGKAYVQKGGFLKDVEGFDNRLYGINDYEASSMDPQQCQLLECTTMAMQDAGITSAHLSGSNTGVYIGSMNNDYGSTFLGKTTKVDNYTATGTSNTILASRLSYVFNLTGPCMVLDTACSASLIAIHQGCQAIRSGDCNAAICGGVNCMLTPDAFIQLSKSRMISPTGLCHTFSDQADGYTRGEGCGVVILKRLTDAIRDGDNIRAIVYTGTNQDGHSVTPMTSPSGEQQKKLLHCIYDKFQVDVSHVDYIEAHGTGTPAGDPVEANSLGSFFTEKGPPHERYIGSVKTNIGHTESAAGVLGLIKVLLMMEHNLIVPSLHCDVPNPKIDLSGHKLVVPKNLIPWTKSHKVAACNSFGFGGSNSHAVVRSYKRHDLDQAPRNKSRCIVCFSGKSEHSLKNSLRDFCSEEENSALDVHDVAYTSTARRDHHAFRTAFIVEDMDELTHSIEDRLSHNKWSPTVPKHLNIVFVFCGMGTAWGGMCRQLLNECPVFRDAVLEVEKHLSAYVTWSLTERLEQEDPSKDTLLASIAIFACQVGLTAVWSSLGVHANCVVGQSIGEIAAAYVAGSLSLPDAVKIIYHRSILLAEVTGGAMIVVQNVEVEEVRKVVTGTKGRASIALEYSSKACAVSADSETMLTLRPQLVSQLKSTNKEMRLIDLDVQVAYHSHHVNKAADKLKKMMNGIKLKAPETPMLSTVTGQIVTAPLTAGHWVDNVKKPVLFHQAMMGSVASKSTVNTIFVEIGPKPVLRAHMHDLFPNSKHTIVPSIMMQSEMKCLFQSITTLYELGMDIDWRSLPMHGTQVAPVPRYSFEKKHLKEKTEQELVLYTGCNAYRKNHLFVYPTEESTESFRLMLSPLTIPSVYQHVVMGSIVVPGALYVECGFAVARQIYAHTNVSVSAEFEQLLLLKKNEPVCVEALPLSSESGVAERQFAVSRKGRKHAAVTITEAESRPRDPVNMRTVRSKCTELVTNANIYSSLKKFGFEYGPAFSLLKDAFRNQFECLAAMELNDTVISEMADTVIHPCILDCMLQTTVLVLGSNEAAMKEMLPKSVGGLVVIRPMEREMCVHARLKFTSTNIFMFEIQLLSPDGHVIAEVTDFTIQALTSTTDKALPNMLSSQWNKVKNITREMLVKETADQQENLLLISQHKLEGDNSGVSHLIYDNKTSENIRKELKTLLTSETFRTVVVTTPEDDYVKKEADATQSELIDLCLLFQSIFIIMDELSLSTPVFMFTLNAWPCPAGSHVRDVNPTSTALWGLLRTLVDEDIYTELVGVDLHNVSHALDIQTVEKLAEFLKTDKDIAGYPEIIITRDSIYVNQVVEVNGSSLSVPEKRLNLPSKLDLVHGNAVVLSQKAFTVENPIAVSHETQSSQEEHRRLKACSFALPPEKLFSTKVSSAHVFPEKTGHNTDYVIMALEVTGSSKETPSEELTSCSPVIVGPELPISKDTSLTTASLPHYHPGDLCKLVLFWSLVDEVSTKHFSILASQDTQHLAELLKLLSCNATKRKESDVNIILIEDLKDSTICHQTILSLVLLDVETMSVMVRRWKNAHSLISLSCLITKDLNAFMACTLHDAQLCLLDTQSLFQLHHLKNVIPKIKEWIQKNAGIMSAVSERLHCTDEVCVGGIHDLLKFQSLDLSALSVQVMSDKLFRRDGAYIVVGGLTGLGWVCVEFLAQNNAGYIAIINRRAPSPEQMNDMNSLARQFSCRIKAFQGDVSSMKSLQQILKCLSEEWSEKFDLKGVFTGAAVLEDGFFPNMPRAAFEKVLTPKVKGTWNLHLLTKDLSLDFFVMHSSVVSVLGNLGQANYVTGNAFMDGMAFHRRFLGLAAQTINWGPLDMGLLDNQELVKQKLNAMGFNLASKQEIRNMMSVLLLLNWSQSVPVTLTKELFSNRIRRTGMQGLQKRFHYLLSGSLQQDSSQLTLDLEGVEKLRFLPPTQRLEAYQEFVEIVTTRILSVDKACISSDDNLFDLGLDSVTGMMMISVIERHTSLKLSPVTVLSGEATVASVAQSLDDLASEAKMVEQE